MKNWRLFDGSGRTVSLHRSLAEAQNARTAAYARYGTRGSFHIVKGTAADARKYLSGQRQVAKSVKNKARRRSSGGLFGGIKAVRPW